MPLSPEDVSNKRFTPVRLREGYDMGEVDQFLDEVEAELERLHKERDDLRTKLEAAQGTGEAPTLVAKPSEKPADKPTDKAGQADQAVKEPAKAEPAAPTAPTEQIKVTTAAEASSAALRLLELATRNADEVVAEARQDADKIVTEARTSAEKVEEEARNRAQNLDSETETKRTELLGDLENEKSRLDGEVENLRAFEREYRSRLKSYFNQQLQALDGIGEGGDLPTPDDEPKDGPLDQPQG